MRHLLAPTAFLLFAATAAAEPTPVETALTGGDLAAGEKSLAVLVEAKPDDAEARFGLGMVRFLRGVERLGRFLHDHGVSEHARQIPFFRLPVPTNQNPKPTSDADCRAMLAALLADLTQAETTLAEVKGDVKLPVAFGRIRLDLDGDGKATEQEALWHIYARFNGAAARDAEFRQQAESFTIAFDAGDVAWLRGYCHLLSAMIEVELAYDGQRWFDHCGHLLFAKAESPYPFLAERKPHGRFDAALISDAIAAIHLTDFPLKEPARLESARKHLLAMTELSRKSWNLILAETDDDREWLPNPKQTGVLGVPVTDEMVAAWRSFLDELDALLAGKKLAPFWRDETQGVNLKRVFTEPRDLDVILWVQGTAAVPYLERGEMTDPQVWNRMMRVFRGEFVGFALWFN